MWCCAQVQESHFRDDVQGNSRHRSSIYLSSHLLVEGSLPSQRIFLPTPHVTGKCLKQSLWLYCNQPWNAKTYWRDWKRDWIEKLIHQPYLAVTYTDFQYPADQNCWLTPWLLPSPSLHDHHSLQAKYEGFKQRQPLLCMRYTCAFLHKSSWLMPDNKSLEHIHCILETLIMGNDLGFANDTSSKLAFPVGGGPECSEKTYRYEKQYQHRWIDRSLLKLRYNSSSPETILGRGTYASKRYVKFTEIVKRHWVCVTRSRKGWTISQNVMMTLRHPSGRKIFHWTFKVKYIQLEPLIWLNYTHT